MTPANDNLRIDERDPIRPLYEFCELVLANSFRRMAERRADAELGNIRAERTQT